MLARFVRPSGGYFFFAGTFAPERRASESPIAIACLRLVTFFPERPERSFPCFISCISVSTDALAFGPYLRVLFFFPPDFFAVDFFAPAFLELDFLAVFFRVAAMVVYDLYVER
jgi:hypothetical protein